MSLSICVDCCTKDRYLTTLPLTLISIANQTHKPDQIIIYDDSHNPIDIGANETLRYIFQMFDSKGIKWKHLWGQRRGQHIGHQVIQNLSETDLIFRVDDDEILEPEVLQNLLSNFYENGEIDGKELKDVGAVGGLVLMPGAPTEKCKPNKIEDAILNKTYNCQWHYWLGPENVVEVEHIYSSYMYRKGIQNYDINLSPVAHREETLHSYGIFKKGYKLIVDSRAVTWHFRASTGGIRTGEQSDWFKDEVAFREIMNEYAGKKVVFLDSGKGDHVVFKKSVWPKIKEKYGKDTILAVCWPDIFPEETCLDIEEGSKYCNPTKHNISKWCIDNNWKDELKYAYARMYDVEIE